MTFISIKCKFIDNAPLIEYIQISLQQISIINFTKYFYMIINLEQSTKAMSLIKLGNNIDTKWDP